MKIKLHTCLFLLICLIGFVQAQVDTLWTKTFGKSSVDEGYSVQQTAAGGYIITGYTYSLFGLDDVWLIKTDSSGDTLWTKTFGGSGYGKGNSVLQTNDSGYILVGYADLFSTGFPDVMFIKVNSFGDTLWTKTFGGIYWDEGLSVQQTIDGGYIITGFTYSFGAGNDDVWLIKTNSSGDTLWTKTFGGWSYDRGHSVYQAIDGGYIITGYTNSFGAGMADVWVIKTNDLGDTLWTRTFGGIYDDKGYSVLQTTDGGYVICGNTALPSSSYAWLIKTNSAGDTLWTKLIGGAGSYKGYSFQQTVDGGYIITGSINEDLWLIKTNSSGDTLWTKTFGEIGYDDKGYSVQQTSDGGYIISGSIYLSTAGGGDVWLIKTTPDVSSIGPNTDLILTNFLLTQNFPNPFNPSTTIEFRIQESELISLKVYDVLGNDIATLVNEYKTSGSYEIEWNASNYPSGIYFYQLRAGNFIETKKMVLLK